MKADRKSRCMWRLRSLSWSVPFLSAVMVAALAASAWAQTEPIKIGFIFCLSGRLATFGTTAKQGAELALEQINASGGVAGRKIEGIFLDSQGLAAVSVEGFTKMVKNQAVDCVIGPSLSSEAVAIAPLARDLKVPFIVPVETAPDITGKDCNRYTFRVGQSLNQNIKSAALVASELQVKRWTTIGPDYVYGHQAWQQFKRYLGELKPGAAFAADQGTAFAPAESKDWSPAIKKIMAGDADGVFISLFSGNLIDFVQQANDLKFFSKGYRIVMNLGASTEVLYALKQDMPVGVWVGAPYWFEADTGAVNYSFVAGYRDRFKGIPSWTSAGAYAAVMAYVAAVREAGSANKDAVVQKLGGLTLEVPAGEITIRREDHQALVPAYWGQTAHDEAFRFRVLRPLRTIPASEITSPPSDSGCVMKN